MVKTEASEAQESGNLDSALDVYIAARKIFQGIAFYQVQIYLYKQLTTPRPLVRNKKDGLFETYEAFEKRLPWPNTSSRLRKAFYDDIESNTRSDGKERQHAMLKLYDATNQDPAPFLTYCRREAEVYRYFDESPELTRSQVMEIVDGCRDAQVVLRHLGEHDNADWLAQCADQEWLDPDEYSSKQFWWRHSGMDYLVVRDDGPPYYPYPGQSDSELSDNQMGHRIAWEFENDLL